MTPQKRVDNIHSELDLLTEELITKEKTVSKRNDELDEKQTEIDDRIKDIDKSKSKLEKTIKEAGGVEAVLARETLLNDKDSELKALSKQIHTKSRLLETLETDLLAVETAQTSKEMALETWSAELEEREATMRETIIEELTNKLAV